MTENTGARERLRQRNERIVALAGQGVPDSDIAERERVSTHTVRRVRYRARLLLDHKLPPSQTRVNEGELADMALGVDTSDPEQVYDLIEAAAEAFGVTRESIRRYLRNMDIIEPADKRGPIAREILARAKVLLDDNVGYAEAARTVGCDPRTLSRHFPGFGLSAEEAGARSLMMQKYRREEQSFTIR